MKKIKNALLASLATVSLFTVASCAQKPADPAPKPDNGTTDVQPEPQVVPTAKEAATTLLIVQNHKEIINDFELLSSLEYNKTNFNVTWSTDNEAVAKVSAEVNADGKYTVQITRPAEGEKDVRVKLVATLTNGTDKATKNFDFTVMANKALTFSDFFKLEAGTHADFKGVVVAKTEYSDQYKNASFSVKDLNSDGAVYSYQTNCTLEEYNKIVRGSIVKISGPKDIFSGYHQIKKGGITLLDGTQEVTPLNISDEVKAGKFVNAKATNEADYLGLHIGNLVRVENVEVLKKVQPNPKKSDYEFVLGYADGQTIDLHLKYSSFSDKTDQYQAWLALNEGDVISANCVMNHRDNAQLYITENLSDLTIVKRAETPEALLNEQVALINNVELPNVATAASPLNVQLHQSTNPKVSITYQANNPELVIENGVLKTTGVLPQTYKTVSFTATVVAKNGGQEATKTLTFSLDLVNELNTWEKYYYAADNATGLTGEGVVYAFGVKTQEDKAIKKRYNSEYFIHIQSALGAYVLNIKATTYDSTNPEMMNILKAEEEALRTKYAVNTTVNFTNGTKQISNGTKHTVVLTDQDITTGVVAPAVEAIDVTADLLAGKDLNRYQGSFIKVTNVLTAGKNLVLLDEAGNPTTHLIEYRGSYDFNNIKLTNAKVYTHVSGLLDSFRGTLQITSFDKTNNDNAPKDFTVAGATVITNVEKKEYKLAENTNEAANFGLDATKFEVIASKGNNTTNNVAIYKDGTTRLYKDGNTLSIKSLEGKKIASVVILGVDNDGLELNGQAVAQGFATITFETPAEALTFVNNGTATIKVAAIYVTFAA